MKGASTGFLPIQVRITAVDKNLQNIIFARGEKADDLVLKDWDIGRIMKIKIDAARARTPPNLFGMDRRIA